jgi:hypothetical protein
MSVRVHPPTAVVAITDGNWFDALRRLPSVDEVNFWQPSPGGAFAALQPGEPFLFKLHSPVDRIVGGGFYAPYERMQISVVWEAFGVKNGVDSLEEMRRRVERYRRPGKSTLEDYEIGCILLEQPSSCIKRTGFLFRIGTATFSGTAATASTRSLAFRSGAQWKVPP